jgi:hypothetical protein
MAARFVSAQAARTGGEGGEEARVVGDLNHDGGADLAVLYTLEGADGGNNYGQHLAVFVRVKKGRFVPVADAVVGGKGYRAVSVASIRNGVILAKTLAYAEGDCSAAPTVQGTTRFVLAGGHAVREQKRARDRRRAEAKGPGAPIR